MPCSVHCRYTAAYAVYLQYRHIHCQIGIRRSILADGVPRYIRSTQCTCSVRAAYTAATLPVHSTSVWEWIFLLFAALHKPFSRESAHWRTDASYQVHYLPASLNGWNCGYIYPYMPRCHVEASNEMQSDGMQSLTSLSTYMFCDSWSSHKLHFFHFKFNYEKKIPIFIIYWR